MTKPTPTKPFELTLRTLTPLHIGDGSQLHSLDYVLWQNNLFRTPQSVFDRFLKKISGNVKEKIVANAEDFMAWAEDIALKMETVQQERKNFQPGQPAARDYNQTIRDLRNSYNLLAYARKIGREKDLTDLLQEPDVVKLPLQMPDKMKQEVRGFQRGADGRPYLPGSSLKGCIRTALLFHYLQNHAEYESIKAILDKALLDARINVKKEGKFGIEKAKKTFGAGIEHEALYCIMRTERGVEKTGEEHNDLLRFLHVSDASFSEGALGVENIDLYLVKKQPQGSRYSHAAERQGQAPAAESVKPGEEFTTYLDFNAEVVLQLHKTPGDHGVMIDKERHFIGWRRKIAALFGITSDLLDTNDRVEIRKHAIHHILKCVQQFSDAQAESYDKWQRNLRDNDRRGEFARQIKAGAAIVLSRQGMLRFHFGYATGFEGMTGVLHIAAFYKPIFKEIMELFGIGDNPTAGKKRKDWERYEVKYNPTTNNIDFPKSRRLATRPGEIVPFGWLEWVTVPTNAPTTALQKGASEKTIDMILASVPDAPPEPRYLKGRIKQGALIDAEIIYCGTPNQLKLFIREGFTPTVALRYGLGFKPEDMGRLVTVRVSGLKGKDEVVAVQFVSFR